jgi:multiple sugar transport system permease protein
MAVLGQGVNSTILILIFQNFFNLIPKSLDEAAMIDGAGPFRVFIHIGLKLSFSTVLVVFLFAFVWNWNETYVTGTLLRSGLQLLPSKLSLFDSEFESAVSSSGSAFKLNEAYKMAATFISIAPLLILYSFVQKRFIEGIENTGITGE